jgi:hypothetical protein
LSRLAGSRDGGYQGPLVSTTPPGLEVKVSYNGSPAIPNEAGIHRVRAVVDDPNYQGEAEADLTLSGPRYDDWIALQLPGPADRGPEADPDGDGLSNLIEYGLGSPPAVPGVNPLAALAGLREPTVIRWQRDLPGVEVVVERSLDLVAWERAEGEVMPGDGDFEAIRVAPGAPGTGKCFFRIRVALAVP